MNLIKFCAWLNTAAHNDTQASLVCEWYEPTQDSARTRRSAQPNLLQVELIDRELVSVNRRPSMQAHDSLFSLRFACLRPSFPENFVPKSFDSPKTYENHWTRSRRDSWTKTKKSCFHTLVCCRRVPNDASKVHVEPGSEEIHLNCDRELSSRLLLWPSRRRYARREINKIFTHNYNIIKWMLFFYLLVLLRESFQRTQRRKEQRKNQFQSHHQTSTHNNT